MRESPERVAEVWLNGFTLLAAVALPALFGLIAVAPDLIPLVFGSQWVPAVPVVQILCVLVMSRTLQTWNNAVMDAAGKPHVAMFINAAVLVGNRSEHLVGQRIRDRGGRRAFSLASLVFRRVPVFRDHDAGALLEPHRPRPPTGDCALFRRGLPCRRLPPSGARAGWNSDRAAPCALGPRRGPGLRLMPGPLRERRCPRLLFGWSAPSGPPCGPRPEAGDVGAGSSAPRMPSRMRRPPSCPATNAMSWIERERGSRRTSLARALNTRTGPSPVRAAWTDARDVRAGMFFRAIRARRRVLRPGGAPR